jgi:hypothetical protein
MESIKIKEAFTKVKNDIDFIYQELKKFDNIRSDIDFLHTEIQEIKRTLDSLKPQYTTPTPIPPNPTLQHKTPTLQHSLEPFKRLNNPISTGNEGVPTNNPTNNPTNQQTIQQTLQHPPISTGNDNFNEKIEQNSLVNNNINEKKESFSIKNEFPTPTSQPTPKTDKISHLQQVSKILESLDSLKREVRIKFKKLTKQEMLIFTTIYQLEEQGLTPDYSLLAEKLSLSEISIRDYIRKIIKKDIPLNKIKQENNRVILSISPDLMKMASLNTIVQLREL